MTMEEKSRRPDRVLRAVLPWAAAAVGLVIYLFTLHPWVSLNSLSVVANVAGWSWIPPLTQPVFYTLTIPFGWLPIRFLPVALNVFSAVCAGLTLAMLARSVILLPRDRVPLFRQNYEVSPTFMPIAWIPPLLAVAGCGFQLTFWEHATAATDEMLTLLLFAFIIRCVLEFRHRGREAWLYWAALVAGLAVPNDWAMLGFLPVFLVALIWVKGVTFFDTRFLVRMTLLGLAGLSFYLLVPLVVAWSPDSSVGVWKALKHNPGSEFGILRFLVSNFYNASRDTAVLLALVSIIPLFFMSLRWKTFSGGTMMAGAWLVTLPFHIVHAGFLGLCLWVFLDPRFSPRVVGRTLGGNMSFLTLYYLAALCLGYYSGYFLHRFGRSEPVDPNNPMPTRRNWGPSVQGIAVLVLLALPALLLLKNVPLIRTAHANDLRQYAHAAVASLPPAGAAVFSDDPLRLGFVEAVLAEQGKLPLYALVDTRMINDPAYAAFLKRRYPAIWTATLPVGTRKLDQLAVLRQFHEVARTNTICYLHPSFGYFFEHFSAEPHGLVSILRNSPTNSLAFPTIAPEVMQASATAWQRLEADILDSLADRMAATDKPEQNFRRQMLKQLKVQPEYNYPLWLASAWYSRALNDWGTVLQRQRQFPEAGNAFRRARDLKPDSLPAIVNLFCNTNLTAGRRLEVDTTHTPETALGRYRGWEDVLNENGPFDAPEFSLGVGQFFMANGLYRQSAQQFYRVTDLVPGFFSAEIALANIDTALGRYDQALSRVADIRASRIFTNLTVLGRTELDLVDAAVWLGKSDLVQADQRIAAILAANPTNLSVMDRVFALHIGKQRHTNAMDLVLRQLELAPNNDRYLVNKSYLWLQMGLFSNSIPVLTQVLTKDSDNFQARFNRAIAYLNTAQLDEAREDYEALEEVAPENAQVQYGLAEVAWRQHRTNATIVHLSNYLSNAPPGTAEAKLVETRLQELQHPGK